MKTSLSFRSPWFLFVSTSVLSLLAAVAQAQSQAPAAPFANLSDTTLERAFWDCDAAATREALSLADGALCASLSDELRQRRFGGDFGRMLVWWQEHKPAEHAARADGPRCDGICCDTSERTEVPSVPSEAFDESDLAVVHRPSEDMPTDDPLETP